MLRIVVQVVLLAFLALTLTACQKGPLNPSITSVKGDLSKNNGRWLSTQKLIKTEWTFHEDGSYDALHQEGEVAAQIRGKYRWDNGLLVADPDRDSIEARSRNKEQADRIQDRLSKGFVLVVTWNDENKFTATPRDGGEPMVFTRM